MVMITLYAKQKKRHRCTEQTFGLCGRRQGWDILREQHWNKYTIKGETDHQPRLDAWDRCSGLVQWEDPEGWDGEGGGRGDRDGEHMYIHGWFMSMYGKKHYNIINKVISPQLIKINEKKNLNANKRCYVGKNMHSNKQWNLELRVTMHILGLSWWFSSKVSTCQCRRHRFEPWVRKIPCRRKWQPTLVFLSGKSHGQRSLVGYSPLGHK